MSVDGSATPSRLGVTVSPPAAASPEPSKALPPHPAHPALPAAEPVPPQIQDFDVLIKEDVRKFVNLGQKIGGLVEEQVWRQSRRRRTVDICATRSR